MTYQDITSLDFKKKFFRELDFTYSSLEYNSTKIYSLNEKAIYLDEGIFTLKVYISKIDNNTSLPTDSNNWDVDVIDAKKLIVDSDIAKYLQLSKNYIDNSLIVNEDIQVECVHLLTAHQLTLNVLNYDKISSKSMQPVSSKSSSTGSFSVSIDTTNLYNPNADLILRQTKYGMLFLDLRNRYTSQIYVIKSDRIIES